MSKYFVTTPRDHHSRHVPSDILYDKIQTELHFQRETEMQPKSLKNLQYISSIRLNETGTGLLEEECLSFL